MRLSSVLCVSRPRTNFSRCLGLWVFNNALLSADITKVWVSTFNRFILDLTDTLNSSRKHHLKSKKSWSEQATVERVRGNIHRTSLNLQSKKQLNPRRNAMAVVMIYTRIMLEIVQHGVQHAGNVTNPTIGRLCVVKSQTEDQTEEGNLVSSPWWVKS